MEIKKLKDYYDIMFKQFPDISKSDIKKILTYGWKQFYIINSRGADFSIINSNFWIYVGTLTNDSLRHFNYYTLKLGLKFRLQYIRNKVPWNGYYYFALTENQYQQYLAQHNKRGRKRKCFTFTNVFLFKVLEECKMRRHNCQYIFKIPKFVATKYIIFERELKTDQAELILIREPLKFKDILTYNHKYEIT